MYPPLSLSMLSLPFFRVPSLTVPWCHLPCSMMRTRPMLEWVLGGLQPPVGGWLQRPARSKTLYSVSFSVHSAATLMVFLPSTFSVPNLPLSVSAPLAIIPTLNLARICSGKHHGSSGCQLCNDEQDWLRSQVPNGLSRAPGDLRSPHPTHTMSLKLTCISSAESASVRDQLFSLQSARGLHGRLTDEREEGFAA